MARETVAIGVITSLGLGRVRVSRDLVERVRLGLGLGVRVRVRWPC